MAEWEHETRDAHGRWTTDYTTFDLSELRDHVRQQHPQIKVPARSNKDLAVQHAHQHTRYHMRSHNHMAGRIKIYNAGCLSSMTKDGLPAKRQ